MKRTIYALDPGSVESGWATLRADGTVFTGIMDNDGIAETLLSIDHEQVVVVIERMRPRGMPTAGDEMRAMEWFGAFAQAAGYSPRTVAHVYRDDAKLHLCGQAGVKDKHVRQALIDRWGGDAVALGYQVCGHCGGTGGHGRGKERRVCGGCNGQKRSAKGPLYDVAGDGWAALAVAVTWRDKNG